MMVGNCNRERMHKMCICICIYIYIYIYYRCRICAVEVCIYVDQLNYTLSLSFEKAVVFTSEYALHFIDCNLFVKLFIDRAPWIQIFAKPEVTKGQPT